MKNKELNYIKAANISKRLYKNYRQPQNKRFDRLIKEINEQVEQILNNVEETEQQARQAVKMGIKKKV